MFILSIDREVKADLFTLVTMVNEHILEKVYGLMLIEITEGTDFFYEVKHGKLHRVDINHLSHKML